ncbi:MAG: hypothetical protein JXQ90_23525 [Cyclobacteriaceae bacterium]
MSAIAKNIRMGDLGVKDADVEFSDSYRLKLTSKKLNSGKCQVKFFATIREKKDMYGYVLVDASKTLKDVVVHIKEKLNTIRQTKDFHHIHLYSIGKVQREEFSFIIFDK